MIFPIWFWSSSKVNLIGPRSSIKIDSEPTRWTGIIVGPQLIGRKHLTNPLYFVGLDLLCLYYYHHLILTCFCLSSPQHARTHTNHNLLIIKSKFLNFNITSLLNKLTWHDSCNMLNIHVWWIYKYLISIYLING